MAEPLQHGASALFLLVACGSDQVLLMAVRRAMRLGTVTRSILLFFVVSQSLDRLTYLKAPAKAAIFLLVSALILGQLHEAAREN
jgi:hypothetical protein